MEQITIEERQLVHITEVAPINDADKPLMDELYEVLKKHDALKRYGITLLHEHFPMDADEALIETTDIANKTQILKTVKLTEIDTDVYSPSSWRLDIGSH